MITNKDISIDSENGKITLNGNKYDLGTQGEIDTAVKDVYSVMGQNGAKNLIPYPYNHTTKTQNGVTFTDNGDGTITIVTSENGATANTTFEFQTRASEKLFLKAGKYTATGCPLIAGGGIVFKISNTNVSPSLTFNDTGSGVTFTLENDLPFGAIFTVSKGTVITTPIVVKPMLRLASDTDNTYQPYAKTNKQLTEQVADVKGTIGDLTQSGVTGVSVAEQITKLNDNNGLIKIEDAQISVSTTKTFDITSNGIYVLALGHAGGNNVLGLYLIKITHYAGGTFVDKVVTPQSNEPTVTASEITGNPEKGSISITTTSQSGVNAGLFRLNMPL